MKIERFEDLRIWKRARELAKEVYSDMDSNRDFGFCNQIQRAAVSVMNNIAEGFCRSSELVFANLLDVAYGSCGEVKNMYYLAEDLGYVTAQIAELRRKECEDLMPQIDSFRNYLRKSNNTKKSQKSQGGH